MTARQRAAAARRGWATRRANAERARRSEAARRAWETRRANEQRARELARERSERARRGWETRRQREREREKDRGVGGDVIDRLSALDGRDLLDAYQELLSTAELRGERIEEIEIESSEPATYEGD